MEQQLTHQMMGYDRASIVFSPDGRLLQVEYAKKTVRKGTNALGMICKEGVVLVADKRVTDKLMISSSVEKIFQVDDHIAAVASGILSDGRVLIERAQLLAQQHRIMYDVPISLISLVKDICNWKQAFTQYGGARPFGVSILFAGVEDDEPRLYSTEPTGIFFQFKATAIGENENEIKDYLGKEYKDGMSIRDGLSLGVKAIKKVLGKEFDIERIDAIYVDIKSKFGRFSRSEIKRGIR